MENKVELVAKLIITYCFILALCFLLYALVVLPVSEADKISSIIGLLGWSATIFAPIAAYFLLDNWKDQKNYELKKEYIGLILNDMRHILSRVLIISSNFSNIKKVDEKLIFNNEYREYKPLQIGNQTINLYGFIKVYSKIDNDTQILELYNDLEIHSFFVDNLYKEIIKLYRNYYDSFSRSRPTNTDTDYDINREYNKNEYYKVIPHSRILTKYAENKHKYIKRSTDGTNEIVLEYTLDELLKRTIDIHNKIQKVCLDQFKP